MALHLHSVEGSGLEVVVTHLVDKEMEVQTILFTHSFHTYLQSTYCVLGGQTRGTYSQSLWASGSLTWLRRGRAAGLALDS